MMDDDTIVTQVLALLQRETGDALLLAVSEDLHGCFSRRPFRLSGVVHAMGGWTDASLG
jgi:hypothetical protein